MVLGLHILLHLSSSIDHPTLFILMFSQKILLFNKDIPEMKD
jgi:hypothetical protein